jgi:phosphoribosyl-ATP pyrophosphohydrolase
VGTGLPKKIMLKPEGAMSGFTIESLAELISTRAASGGEKSYTRKLLDKGPEHCARKMGEEAIEAIIAATLKDRAGLVAESADVVYHLLVLLQASGIPLREVEAELERRTAMSGLEEKASRKGS